MDGPWQIGHLDVEEYGKKAREAAKMLRWHDPSVELILCGSSNDQMATYPEWDRVALELCWEQVNYLSMHYYAGNWDGDTTSYLAIAAQLESFVDTLAVTLRYVKAKRRSKRDVYLSWDEWQVWYKDRSGRGGWSEAPHLSEEIYNLEDALVVAQWLNVFLRKCDVLKIACVAQVVNIISWLQTKTDGLLKQVSFYPFMLVSTLARGNSLDVLVKSPMHATNKYGDQPLLDVSASHDPASGAGALFIVNRSQTEAITTNLTWQSGLPQAINAVWQLSGTDVKATNTWEEPNRIVARQLTPPALQADGVTIQVPPLSFTALELAYPKAG
jgi:alpha-N-arabinofuranosidase